MEISKNFSNCLRREIKPGVKSFIFSMLVKEMMSILESFAANVKISLFLDITDNAKSL